MTMLRYAITLNKSIFPIEGIPFKTSVVYNYYKVFTFLLRAHLLKYT